MKRRRAKTNARPRSAARSGGMTLVETLVAMVVFAIGLSGIAALLVLGLRTQREAAREAGAVTLLAGVGEEIRALHGGDPTPLRGLGALDLEQHCRTAPASCERETAAVAALEAWRTRVQQVLGASAIAAIEVLDDAPAAYRARVEWSERQAMDRLAVARIEP